MSNETKMHNITINLEESELQFVDKLVDSKDSIHPSRSEYIRQAIHEKIVRDVEFRYKFIRVQDGLIPAEKQAIINKVPEDFMESELLNDKLQAIINAKRILLESNLPPLSDSVKKMCELYDKQILKIQQRLEQRCVI